LSREIELSKCKDERIREVDRYYQTVLLTIGLKDHLDNHAKECRFVSAEPRFFAREGHEIRPDVVIQYTSGYGALCEIKTSLPMPDGYLLNSLSQIEKYSIDVTGWDTPDHRVKDHDILLFCHALDFDRVVQRIQQWLEDGSIKISKKLCICEWSTITSPKTGKDVVLIRKRFGDTSCDELNRMLQENIVVDIQKVVIDYEKCKFTRKEPPLEYTMQELWVNVFREMTTKTESFEVSIDEILKVAIDYYIPWSNIEGEYSQVRRTWIRKAVEGFCAIGLAEQSESNPQRFRILHQKQIQKDILDYMIEALCNLTIKQTPKRPMVDQEATTPQKPLSDFTRENRADVS